MSCRAPAEDSPDVPDPSRRWAVYAWTALGITAAWGIPMGVFAARARDDWRMMAGLFESLIWLAGIVVGLIPSTILAAIGTFVRGRYRRRSLLALGVCVLAWVTPFIIWAAIELWRTEHPMPPGPAHGDMLGLDVESSNSPCPTHGASTRPQQGHHIPG